MTDSDPARRTGCLHSAAIASPAGTSPYTTLTGRWSIPMPTRAPASAQRRTDLGRSAARMAARTVSEAQKASWTCE
jgi:hypothetical protein